MKNQYKIGICTVEIVVPGLGRDVLGDSTAFPWYLYPVGDIPVEGRGFWVSDSEMNTLYKAMHLLRKNFT